VEEGDRTAAVGSASATGVVPLTRTAQRQRRTRTQLLAAGHEQMSRVGVDATTIIEITELADVGFGTFYNYFDSKEALAADVLDCVIDNLGRRNDLVTSELGESDPVRIVANSVRLVSREMLRDPMWRSWVANAGLLVDRMREGFRPYGHRDFHAAMRRGKFALIGDDVEFAWGYLNWLIVGGVSDILSGRHDASAERQTGEAILRVLGVPPDEAEAATRTDLPPYPELAVDFRFRRSPNEPPIDHSIDATIAGADRRGASARTSEDGALHAR
jgi:AcrR family transcriptional regulator